MLTSAVVGATAAALSTAAGSAEGLSAMAADVTALHAPVPDSALGMEGPGPAPAGVAAETPMNGRAVLAAAEARSRTVTLQATRAARTRQLALVEAARPKWQLPLPPRSYRISSAYGPRWGTLHNGLDMAAPAGTPVYAAGDGIVLEPRGTTGYGNVVVVQHADGNVTLYGHNSKVLVDPGERVKAGQLIALVGSTGYSTGNHLHFEVRAAGMTGGQSDPTAWLSERGIVV